ncbi:hypothetical protein GCM10027418_03890 [Mariniluteicoccus endophyticus]
MELTSPGLAVALTLALPALAVWAPRREGRHTPAWSATRWRVGVRPSPRRWWEAVGRWSVLVLAQLLAVVTSFVLINDWLRFYPTWRDLLGRPAPAPVIENRDEPIPTPGPGGAPTTRVPTPSGATEATVSAPTRRACPRRWRGSGGPTACDATVDGRPRGVRSARGGGTRAPGHRPALDGARDRRHLPLRHRTRPRAG